MNPLTKPARNGVMFDSGASAKLVLMPARVTLRSCILLVVTALALTAAPAPAQQTEPGIPPPADSEAPATPPPNPAGAPAGEPAPAQ